MRPHIITLCILAFLSMCMTQTTKEKQQVDWTMTGSFWKHEVADAKTSLISAIITVESGGDDAAVGDGGKAVGCLQIHPTMVKEVNRILGSPVYTLSDRKDRTKSIAMFKVYTNKHTPSWSPELVARRWNGGPNGDMKKATLAYWQKVQKHL